MMGLKYKNGHLVGRWAQEKKKITVIMRRLSVRMRIKNYEKMSMASKNRNNSEDQSNIHMAEILKREPSTV